MVIPTSIQHATIKQLQQQLFLNLYFCCSLKVLSTYTVLSFLILLLALTPGLRCPIKVTTCVDVSNIWHNYSHSSFWNTLFTLLCDTSSYTSALCWLLIFSLSLRCFRVQVLFWPQIVKGKTVFLLRLSPQLKLLFCNVLASLLVLKLNLNRWTGIQYILISPSLAVFTFLLFL